MSILLLSWERCIGYDDGISFLDHSHKYGLVSSPELAFPISLRLLTLVVKVLGLHLPVMKLCLGDMSCVIENRLESEDSELERRLLRLRRPSSGSDATRPPPIPARPAAPSPAMPALRLNVAAGSGSGATEPPHEYPLSHTWHGGTNRTPVRKSVYVQEEEGVGRHGRAGSRANLLKPSRIWGAGRSSRIEDEESPPPTATGEGPGTPAKSVKFMLGRKGTDSGVLASMGGGSNGGASGGPLNSYPSSLPSTAVVKTAVAAGDGVGRQRAEAGEQAKDPRAAVMNVTVQARLWADYFNNTLRCWEALLDPFR